ncbi:tetraacyldisaccharide 4'-kinase [Gluconacetobacter diazotrophicus PA1 5]|uniref:Tetraacyldisaccharide 4'-kinase n=2 Tax=Gluconacetobacter diazotrophicus TaxID=33996 RepID=LPXK_GLUDA|nr:tetraacyldisaccharide 4'-kinase [Gluconacetobacter diazotrophicus]A9H0Y0.1 RecName: Full=Tetraacyldisaccharide 4'-kinase; AltName: Full=Lipid A 4'-kinase [Gluconacetobacter diazotrophicus PA1 5]ACI52851.1 tetraacyldisaccharide 4'-kinase [Gluconacetobacter diazotrophicus PA1 5]MBB2155410.1 tetraacyldisaccharide 4'-kinase [Gluconacetobacter diazotrophicus]TWB09004.1 lipid-A-disaccharide kinase [Gluconacetobacter diazotrophicus]CAP57186.1 putative tetraacyldisaccharide 4'-kinase [Gluconacetoba
MHAPRFWSGGDGGWPARLLAPAAALYTLATARRMRGTGWRAPVPVLCCGNLTAGGAGKTTVALDLAARLVARGRHVHILTRGYGGRARGPLLVDPARHSAAEVGDEALLLARVAPCHVSADRAAGARAAVAAGADCLVMDDGFQNPGLRQDMGLLVIDGGSGFGNGHVLPAGPLREPVAQGCRRARAAILIGGDRTGALAHLPPALPVLRADLAMQEAAPMLAGRPAIAFAGIGRPDKFFDGLRAQGIRLAACLPFPDHHAYRPRDVRRLSAMAAVQGAVLLTTPKDAVRLPPAIRAQVRSVDVTLAWADPMAPERLLDMWLDKASS